MADRVAVVSAQRQRGAELRQLVQHRRTDAAALRNINHLLAMTRRAGHRIGANVETADQLVSLMEQLDQQQQTVSGDSAALATARQTDFAPIHAAREQAAADARAYIQAKRRDAA